MIINTKQNDNKEMHQSKVITQHRSKYSPTMNIQRTTHMRGQVAGTRLVPATSHTQGLVPLCVPTLILNSVQHQIHYQASGR